MIELLSGQLTDIILDTLIDAARIAPFLFAVYLLIELLENRAGEKSLAVINKAGRAGPILGGLLGVVPQCGFSAATSNLYSVGVISRGTLLAVFLSTSDEMLPIMLSERVAPVLIIKILAVKFLTAAAVGTAADMIERRVRKTPRETDIHAICEASDCDCEHGILLSALKHTVSILLFIIGVSFVLNIAVCAIGEENLKSFILNKPIIGEALSALIGLIPNCAASVAITQLYLEGAMSTGAMLSGLLCGSGVGVLVLFRMNRNLKDNLLTLVILYCSAIVCGILLGSIGIF